MRLHRLRNLSLNRNCLEAVYITLFKRKESGNDERFYFDAKEVN